MSRSRSIRICVNVPSPDQADVSSSNGMVNGHQPAQDRIAAYTGETSRLEQVSHRFGTGVLPDRRGNVAIGVGIAVEHPAERGAGEREIGEIHGAHETIRRAVEIER